MAETVGNMDKDQLTRLAQYFDERVISATNYKITRGQISRLTEW